MQVYEKPADRAPRSMNDLLKMSIKYHESEEDRTTKSGYDQMDPERRKFLDQALKAMTVDELENIRRSLKVLQGPETDEDTGEQVAEKEGAMTAIHDLVDSLDNARGKPQP